MLLMLCGAAQADPLLNRLHGTYVASTPWPMTLRTIVLSASDRIVAAEVVVGHAGCSGIFSGLGQSDGQRIVLRAHRPESPQEQRCELSLSLDRTGQTATLSARDCGSFHGAACELSGELKATDPTTGCNLHPAPPP